ncbi:hypothetical protein PRJ39_07970 [Lysobacter enzymogenes]
MTVLTPLLLVSVRSATGVTVSVTLPGGVGSVVPAGGVTVTVLLTEPLLAVTVATTVKTSLPPEGSVGTVTPLSKFATVTVGHTAAPLARQVTLVLFRPAAAGSRTTEPSAALGPALLSSIVYVVGSPALTVLTPLLLVSVRSATGVTVSVSVTLPGGVGSVVPAGGVTVTVLLTEPLLAVTVATTVKTSLPPEGSVGTVTPLSKFATVTVGHTAAPLARQVTLVLFRPAAAGSRTTEPSAALGPALLSSIVYVVGSPALTVLTPLLLVSVRSATGVTVSVSVTLPGGVGSVVPAGGVTVTVLLTEPLLAVTVATTVKTSLPPDGSVGTVTPLSKFATVTVGHTAAPLARQVTLVLFRPAAAGSRTTEPSAALGPALLSSIVYVVGSPALTVLTPLLLVSVRSATGVTVSVSVTLPGGVGSVVPAGGVTVTVLLTEPLLAVTVATTVKTSLPPDGSVGTVTPLSKFATVTVGHTAAPLARQVTLVLFRPAAAGSRTTEPSAALGPALLSSIVYVVGSPALTVLTPLLLVSVRSATGVTVSVSVTLPGGVGSVVPAGGVTVTVLLTEPLLAVTVAITVKTSLPPEGSVGTVTPLSKFATVTVGHTAEPVARQVTLVLFRPAAAGSRTTEPSAALGPALLSSIVYVVGSPALTVLTPLLLVSVRSATGMTGSVSVTVPVGVGSVVFGGRVAVTELLTEPLVAVTLALTVKVRVPPDGSVAIVNPLSKLATVTAGHTALPVARQVTLVLLRPAAAGSRITVPLAALGPLLVSTTV